VILVWVATKSGITRSPRSGRQLILIRSGCKSPSSGETPLSFAFRRSKAAKSPGRLCFRFFVTGWTQRKNANNGGKTSNDWPTQCELKPQAVCSIRYQLSRAMPHLSLWRWCHVPGQAFHHRLATTSISISWGEGHDTPLSIHLIPQARICLPGRPSMSTNCGPSVGGIGQSSRSRTRSSQLISNLCNCAAPNAPKIHKVLQRALERKKRS